MLKNWIPWALLRKLSAEPVEFAKPEWNPDTTWFSWMAFGTPGYPSPYGYKLIRLMRSGWDRPKIVDPSALSGEMNVCGLYWQPFDGEIIDGDWVQGPALTT